MRTEIRRAFFTALVLLPTVVPAQVRTTGQITGRVTDEEGHPITGAAVTVTSTETGLKRQANTDRNGAYLFPLLPVGRWTVTLTAEGKQPQVYSLRLGIGESVPIDAVLLAGEVVAEEVTVYGTAKVMEQPQSQLNLDYGELVEELPIENRDINLVARLAPQVSDNTFIAKGLSVAGAPTFDTTVLLDGAEISDPINGVGPDLYLEDAIEEVQVLTSGIGARYGRFQGGIINAVTRSGSNEYEATGRWEFSKEAWNEKTPFGEEQSEELNQVTQLTVGGFLLKDRAWFFAGYREVPSFTENGTTAYTRESFATKRTEERWSVKLRGAPASNHVIDVSHLEFENRTSPWRDAQVHPAHQQALTGLRRDPKKTNSALYQGVLTPEVFVELQATEKEAGISAGGAPNDRDPFLDWASFDVFNNYWWDQSDVERRDNETAAANLTYSLVTESAGTHTFEGGYQYVSSTTAGANKQSPTLYNLIGFNSDFVGPPLPDGEPTFNLRNGLAERWKALPLEGDQEIENTALYVQDSVDLGKWRLALGLRWDDYEGSGPLPEFNMAFDDLATRLAVTYNINDRWQVVGTWGEYVSRLNDNSLRNTTGIGHAPAIDATYTGPDLFGLTADEAQAVVRDDSQWLKVTSFVSPDVTAAYLADDLIAPVAEDRTLSLRYALPRNAGTLELTWVDRSFHDLIDDYVGEVCNTGIPFSGPEGCPADDTTGIPDETGAIVGAVDTRLWANNPDAVREYSGVSLAADYRPNARWRIGGNYTYSETVGNYEGSGRLFATQRPGTGTALGDYPRSIGSEVAEPYGYLQEDVRHRVRAWALYRFDFGGAGRLALSTLYSSNSGFRWSKTALVPRLDVPEYVSAGGTYTHFFGDRGSERYDDIQWLDLGIRYDVPIWRRLGTFVKMTVGNLFDFDTLLGFRNAGVAVEEDGVLQWQPAGNCGLDDEPSKDCTAFGRIGNRFFYQRPREYFFTIGLRWE